MLDALTQVGMDIPYTTQSGLTGISVGSMPLSSTLQTTEIIDGASDNTYEVVSSPDSTFSSGLDDDMPLNEFLARPIELTSFLWDVNTSFNADIPVWLNFVANPRVSNRIANFSRIRMKLNVKFMITGNGFHYGRIIASYTPLHNTDTMTVCRFNTKADQVQATQRPYVQLDPTTSTGGTLKLPFFWDKDALDVASGTDFDDMGIVNMRSLVNLQQANGNLDPVRISVIVWAEDVHLSMPTQVNPSFMIAQSGKKSNKSAKTTDEYGEGIISRPASLVAMVTKRLSDVPIIGPYARATSIAAGATATIAKMFGYSRPAQLEAIAPYKPMYVGDMAACNTIDTSQRMALDAKQEVTIDTRTFGLDGKDEMVLSDIASRESYLDTFVWTESSAQGTMLMDMQVTPRLNHEVPGAFPEYHMPACCYASSPFQNWRGTMRFRFQVIASAYHRGRLRVVYDPQVSTLNPEYNIQYSTIIDIAEKRDFTIEVGWGAHTGMLPMHDIWDATGYSIIANTLSGDVTSNGSIAVYVMNELQSPSAVTANISVLAWVSCADDVEFASPNTEMISQLSVFQTQSGMTESTDPKSTVDMAAEDDDMLAKSDTDVVLAVKPGSSCEALMVYAGEVVPSLRTLCKRYDYWRYMACESAGERINKWSMPTYLPYFGWDPTGLDTAINAAANPVPFTFANMTILHWTLMAFGAHRGSLRYKFVRESTDEQDQSDWFTFFRKAGISTSGFSYTFETRNTMGASVGTRARAVTAITRSFGDGGAVTPMRQNPSLEVEVPWYDYKRFLSCRTTQQGATPNSEEYHKMQLIMSSDTRSSHSAGVYTYWATGEDFQTAFYLGPPTLYAITGALPTAV